MIIRTKDFILRPIKISDAKDYWEVMQDKKTKKGFMNVPKNFREAKKELKELINRTKRKVSEVFAIEVDKEYAGSIILEYQNWDKETNEGRVHLWIHPKFRKKGLATKSLMEIICYGFNRKKFKRIFAQCKTSNKEIIKVIKKCGFKQIKRHKVEDVDKILWVINK